MFGLEFLLYGAVACSGAVVAWYLWSALRTVLIDHMIPWTEKMLGTGFASTMRQLVAFVDDTASVSADVARRLAVFARRILCLDIIYRRLPGNRVQRTITSRVFDGEKVERTVTKEVLSLDDLSAEDRKALEQLKDEHTLSLAPRLREQVEAACQKSGHTMTM